MLIDVLAFGLIIPVLPHLIEDFTGGDTAHAAYWVGIFGAVFAAIQFVTAPIQGALSDRHGRRPVILLSCLGPGLDFIAVGLGLRRGRVRDLRLRAGRLGVPDRHPDQRAVGAGGAVDAGAITRQVGADVQGRIQGALMSLVSLAGIVGPAIFAGSFGLFIGKHAPMHLPGAPFLIAAALLMAAVAIAWRVARVPVAAPAAAAPVVAD